MFHVEHEMASPGILSLSFSDLECNLSFAMEIFDGNWLCDHIALLTGHMGRNR